MTAALLVAMIALIFALTANLRTSQVERDVRVLQRRLIVVPRRRMKE